MQFGIFEEFVWILKKVKLNYKKGKKGRNLGGPITPSMITCATCTPNARYSLARHCDNALNANFPQPAN